MANKREAEYKPLLYTTTVRNPRRVKALLNILVKYNDKILTNQLAILIVGELIRYGLYRPMKISAVIKDKWSTTDKGQFAEMLLTDKEVDFVIRNNPQAHKEAGFDRGYPSRFATLFDFAKELGFVYFRSDEKIIFSELGMQVSKILEVTTNSGEIIVEEKHPEYENQVFLQAMSKSQRNNPFVRVLNDNIPLILLLQVIKKLNADPDMNNAGITRQELPLLIFWKDNNAEALYQRIKRLRSEYGYTPSDEVVIDICLSEIMNGYKAFKPKSIMSEYPDEFIRKMRLTGLITLRGAGRFVDINHNEDAKVDYVIAKYSKYKKYDSELEYFNHMSKIDVNLFNIAPKKVEAQQSEHLLNNWIKAYSWEQIKLELMVLHDRSVSQDETLKFIPAPARLEFLTALAIKFKLPDVRVIPNYPCDDEGLPTSTAGGNQGDIICYESTNGILVEVTMATGRSQTMMEIWPIARHLETLKRENSSAVAYFIAPSIFVDSKRQIRFTRQEYKLSIEPLTISDFATYLENNSKLYYTH